MIRGEQKCARLEAAQVAKKPPSTGKVDPVIMPLRLLSRKRMASTTSSTSVREVAVKDPEEVTLFLLTVDPKQAQGTTDAAWAPA